MEKPSSPLKTIVLPVDAPLTYTEAHSNYIHSTKLFTKERKNYEGRRNPLKPRGNQFGTVKEVYVDTLGEKQEVEKSCEEIFKEMYAEFVRGLRFSGRVCKSAYRHEQEAWIDEVDDDDEEVKCDEEKEVVLEEEHISLDNPRVAATTTTTAEEQEGESILEEAEHGVKLISQRQHFLNNFFSCPYCAGRYDGNWEKHSAKHCAAKIFESNLPAAPVDSYPVQEMLARPVYSTSRRKPTAVKRKTSILIPMDQNYHCLCGYELKNPSMFGEAGLCPACYRKKFHPPTKERRTK